MNENTKPVNPEQEKNAESGRPGAPAAPGRPGAGRGPGFPGGPRGKAPSAADIEEGERRHRGITPTGPGSGGGRGRGPGRGPGGRGRQAEKPKDFKGTVKKLLKYIKVYLPFIIIALICSVTSSVLSVIGPNMLKKVTNLISAGLQTGIDMDSIFGICLKLAILYVISALLGYVQTFILVTVTQRISRKMRSDIDKKINKLPLSYFDRNSFGDVLSRVTNDVDTISQTLNSTIASLLSSITMFVGSLVMMLRNSWILSLSAIGATILGFAFMSFIVSHSQKYFLRAQNYLGDLNGHVEEMFSAHTVVKAYNAEKWAKEEFDDINDHLRDNQWKSRFLGGMMGPFMSFVGNLGYVVICVVGGALTLTGRMEFGVIIAFTSYIRMFTQPLNSFAQVANNLQSTAAAGERVFDFLAEEEMPDESHKIMRLDDCQGEVEFDHVRFGYTTDRVIIHDFSAKALPGQKIAIVGPTGAGKTTLVNLLMRFYDLDGGRILIDGVNAADMTRENVHDLFGMVLQDTWLFEGTIRENLCYSKEGITDEDLEKACRAVGIHHFIKTLPHGYDTVLNDASSLSAGQKQQLTIARAMIENAPLLILDEATSSVDTRTERVIQAAMDQLTHGRTSFVIAHRLSTIRNADLILVMRDGDIIESGNHEQLLEQGGFYAELYNSQFESAS